MVDLLILVPLAGLVLLNLPMGRASSRTGLGLVLILAVAQAALVALHPAGFWSRGGVLEQFFNFHLSASDVRFGPDLQPFNPGMVLLLAIGIVMFSATMAGWAMMKTERHRSNLASVLLLAMAGMNGVVLVSDLFSLYVFLEVTSVSSFVMIALYRDRGGLEGAFKYIVMSAVATVLMLGSVSILLMMGGGTSFEAIKAALVSDRGNSAMARVAVGAFTCGLFIKGGLVPFHGWLPAAYSASPSPVSVLLAGIVTKVSGIYALIRLAISVFPQNEQVNQALMFIGAISIVVGALAAITQSDMKRLLAYSSISQVGYIVLALGCGTPLAMAGAIFHLFNHSIFKSLLFINSAAVEQRLGTTDMSRMGGLGSRMPVTSITSVVAALSTAGIPPLSGFWSKLIIVIALWKADHMHYAVLAVLLSVLTLAYLLAMHRKVFFGKVREDLISIREASPGLLAPEVVLAAITIFVGLLLPWMYNTFVLPAGGLL